MPELPADPIQALHRKADPVSRTIVNHWDLITQSNGGRLVETSGGFYGHPLTYSWRVNHDGKPSDPIGSTTSIDNLLAAVGPLGSICLGSGWYAWVPLADREKFEALTLDRSGKPIKIAPGLPCIKATTGTFSNGPCMRPIKAKGLCGMHLGVETRRATEQAEMAERRQANEERYARQEENQRRATEALAVLRAAVEPLGIRPDTITAPNQTVELPPEVAEALAQFLTEYDELRNL